MKPGFLRRFGGQNIAAHPLVTEHLTATELTHDWANLTSWTNSNVQVATNRLYGVAGGNPAAAGRAFAATATETVKLTCEIQNVGTNAGTQYIGLNFGGTNDGVNASLPNFCGIGIGSASRRPTTFFGANFIGSPTGNVFLSADTLAAGAYRATVVADNENISLVLRSQDGSAEYSISIPRSIAPNSGAVTSIICWNGATNGTSGSYVKAIGVRKSLTPFLTTSNAAGTIEGNTGNVIWRNITDRWRIHLPADLYAFTPTPIVVYMHQASTGDADSPMTESRLYPVTDALDAAGYILLSADDGGDRWGNAASLTNYEAIVDWIRARVYCGPVFLLGCSGGAASMFNAIARRKMRGVIGAAGICPVVDLDLMEANPSFEASIRAAYSAADHSQYVTNSAGFNPAANGMDSYSRVAFRFYAGIGGTDTLVPREQHVDVLNGQLELAGVTTSIETAGSGHLQVEQYQPADLVSFFNSLM